MPAILALIAVMVFAVAFVPINPETHVNVGPFLLKVTEEQQAEIAFAQLAIQKTENELVRAFGLHMIQDHKKIQSEVAQLALQLHVGLYPRLNQQHERQAAELSQLTGTAFDRAYLTYAFHDHDNTVKQLEDHGKALHDPDIKQWIGETLPTINAHHEKARRVYDTLQTEP